MVMQLECIARSLQSDAICRAQSITRRLQRLQRTVLRRDHQAGIEDEAECCGRMLEADAVDHAELAGIGVHGDVDGMYQPGLCCEQG